MKQIDHFWSIRVPLLCALITIFLLFLFGCQLPKIKPLPPQLIAQSLATKVASVRQKVSSTAFVISAPPRTNPPPTITLSWELANMYGQTWNGYPNGFEHVTFSFEHRTNLNSPWVLYVKTNIASIRVSAVLSQEEWRVSYSWDLSK